MAAGRRDCRGGGEGGSGPFVLGFPGRQALTKGLLQMTRTPSVEKVVLYCYEVNRSLAHTARGPREGPGNHEGLDSL
jgi:hypothetical protein